jgi:hypothetical protein
VRTVEQAGDSKVPDPSEMVRRVRLRDGGVEGHRFPARWGDADIQLEELRYGGDNLSADQISAWRDTSERAIVVPMQRSTTTG